MCYKIGPRMSLNRSQNMDTFLKTCGMYNDIASLIDKKRDKKRDSKAAFSCRSIINLSSKDGQQGRKDSPLSFFVGIILFYYSFFSPQRGSWGALLARQGALRFF